MSSGSAAISPQIESSQALPRAALDHPLQEPQHGGMGRLVEVGDVLVVAVDRERVLDEVVGADREEVDARAP